MALGEYSPIPTKHNRNPQVVVVLHLGISGDIDHNEFNRKPPGNSLKPR